MKINKVRSTTIDGTYYEISTIDKTIGKYVGLIDVDEKALRRNKWQKLIMRAVAPLSIVMTFLNGIFNHTSYEVPLFVLFVFCSFMGGKILFDSFDENNDVKKKNVIKKDPYGLNRMFGMDFFSRIFNEYDHGEEKVNERIDYFVSFVKSMNEEEFNKFAKVSSLGKTLKKKEKELSKTLNDKTDVDPNTIQKIRTLLTETRDQLSRIKEEQKQYADSFVKFAKNIEAERVLEKYGSSFEVVENVLEPVVSGENEKAFVAREFDPMTMNKEFEEDYSAEFIW